MQTINDLVESAGKYEPQRIALITEECSFTYAKLNSMINRLANGLLEIGLNKGERVMLLIPNSLELVISHLAVIRSGGISVPLNVMCRQKEIKLIGNETRSKIIIADSQLWNINKSVRNELLDLKLVIIINDEENEKSYRSIFSKNEYPPGIDCGLDDIASIIFTSGTTGRPKGATQTHRSITSSVMGCCVVNKLSRNDCLICGLPLYNNFGLNVMMMSAFFSGAKMVLIDRFDARKVLDSIKEFKGTYFAGTPTMFVYMLEAYKSGFDDLSSMRVTNSGGANCSTELINNIEKVFGVVHLDGYGQTEACGFATLNPFVGVRKTGSSGTPISNVEIKIFDTDDREVDSKKVGEIVQRGDVFSIHKYWENSETNEKEYRKGWFHTGDLGYIDSDGYLYVVGRLQDLIITGGQNIYPAEVEEVIQSHPKVSMAVVVGVPDKVKGELAKAYIILKKGEGATEKEIIDYVRNIIAKYKAPRMVEFVDSLPLGPTGKILKREVRKMAIKSLISG